MDMVQIKGFVTIEVLSLHMYFSMYYVFIILIRKISFEIRYESEIGQFQNWSPVFLHEFFEPKLIYLADEIVELNKDIKLHTSKNTQNFNLAPSLLIGIPKEQLFDNQWIYLMAHVGVI